MKNVLNYQSTEYDCGPVTLTNALRFLFEREEIQPEVVKAIALYTLDAYSEEGEYGKSGTSRLAMQFLAGWMTQFGRAKRYPLSAVYLSGCRVKISTNSEVVLCLQQGGAAVVRCWLGGDEHYILLTGIVQGGIAAFDPYAVSWEEFLSEHPRGCGVTWTDQFPYSHNLIICPDVLNAQDRRDYALGERDAREAMLVYNKNTVLNEENSVEYMI